MRLCDAFGGGRVFYIIDDFQVERHASFLGLIFVIGGGRLGFLVREIDSCQSPRKGA